MESTKTKISTNVCSNLYCLNNNNRCFLNHFSSSLGSSVASESASSWASLYSQIHLDWTNCFCKGRRRHKDPPIDKLKLHVVLQCASYIILWSLKFHCSVHIINLKWDNFRWFLFSCENNSMHNTFSSVAMTCIAYQVSDYKLYITWLELAKLVRFAKLSQINHSAWPTNVEWVQ